MPAKLPRGWIDTRLGEIACPGRSRVLPREHPELSYVGLEHIESNSMRLLGKGHAGDVRSTSILFEKGDVLYGKMRPYLNKVWVAEFAGLCSAEFLVFPHTEHLNSVFLALRLNADDFVKFANRQVSGDRPRIHFKRLSSFPIHLPPLNEQARIAAKVSESFIRMHASQSAAQRGAERLEKYHAAVLHAGVIGELTRDWRKTHKPSETGVQLLRRLLKTRRAKWEIAETHRLREGGKPPKGDKWKSRYREPEPPTSRTLPELPRLWVSASIDQLGWASGYGTSVKCTYGGKGPAVLRIPNIRHRELNLDDLKFAVSTKGIREEKFVAPGDLLLIRTNGSKNLIGRAAVIKKPPAKKCSFASYLIRFQLVGDQTLWSWISIAWDSHILRTEIQSRAATTAGQYNVSLSGLSNLALPLPPSSEQSEIVREVERRLAAAGALATTLNHQIEHVRASRQSVLRAAFSGHLVLQDANDEPASILLERIRTAREIESKKPKFKLMPRVKTKPTRRPLLDVLRAHKKPISPEVLFRESGFQQEFESNEYRQDIVDKFYDELSEITGPRGPVTEKRPNRNTVLLELK